MRTEACHAATGARPACELADIVRAYGDAFRRYAGVDPHSAREPDLERAAAAHGIVLVPGQELTIDTGHANALGDIGWVDFREPPDAWLEATEQAGGLLSVNHPIGGHVSWATPMKRRPPLLEVWHWSWLDTHWTTPLGWWMAWDPAAIPVGGSDWHRPGNDALPGTPTTWAEAEADDPAAKRRELIEQFREIIDVYIAAGNDMIDDVIDPRETRATICRALEMSAGKRVERPWKRSGVVPV